MTEIEYLKGVRFIIDDYLKNIAHCACQDYGLLNDVALETERRLRQRKELDAKPATRRVTIFKLKRGEKI